jgi:HAD superfamily hydrolase (TIGR01493 family)
VDKHKRQEQRGYISFDLDGTLVDSEFVDLVWLKGIPELYAQKEGMDLFRAQELVINEYSKVGDGVLEWYDIGYWFNHFGLPGKWEDLLKQYSHNVRVYPEVHEVLGQLRERYSLIVLSNAAREFIDVEMEKGGLEGYFDQVVSATSDFGMVKKSAKFYKTICEDLNINPQTLIHVGDHWEFDYQIPKQMGIVAYYIDRKDERRGPDSINNLRSLHQILDSGGNEGCRDC